MHGQTNIKNTQVSMNVPALKTESFQASQVRHSVSK